MAREQNVSRREAIGCGLAAIDSLAGLGWLVNGIYHSNKVSFESTPESLTFDAIVLKK